MNRNLLILFCLLLTLRSTGQDDDIQRPDDIRANRVRTRTTLLGGGSRSTIVSSFDRAGRLTRWVLTDNETGKNPQVTIVYRYDSSGKAVAATSISTTDTLHSAYEYGSDQQLRRKITRFPNGTLQELSEFTYNPKFELVSRYWDNGEVYRQDSSFYDAQGRVARYSGVDESDTLVRNWNYLLEHETDASGRLLRQVTRSEGKIILVEDFGYDARGLLLFKESTHSMMGGFKSREQYTYTFY
ncbi:hypothetical protein [Flaviaesturariibacter amylovorans]|uniref:RHS repeat protein n=1 Tax=Flaviaesturariibacter amylovorans TaxID=1084520 RepID=A0ABP8G591_9BACT